MPTGRVRIIERKRETSPSAVSRKSPASDIVASVAWCVNAGWGEDGIGLGSQISVVAAKLPDGNQVRVSRLLTPSAFGLRGLRVGKGLRSPWIRINHSRIQRDTVEQIQLVHYHTCPREGIEKSSLVVHQFPIFIRKTTLNVSFNISFRARGPLGFGVVFEIRDSHSLSHAHMKIGPIAPDLPTSAKVDPKGFQYSPVSVC